MGHRPFPPRCHGEAYRRDLRHFMPPAFAGVESQLRRFTRLLRQSKVQPRTRYEAALWSHFARGCDTALGVVTLADRGHGELALGAARLSFELTISAYWMTLDADPRVDQYERFAAWEDLKILELYDALDVPPPQPVEEVRAIAERKKAQAAGFKGWLGWTQRSLPSRCTEVARRWTTPHALSRLSRFQALATTLGNRGAHPGPKDAIGRMDVEAGFVVRFGPHALTHVWAALALQITAWSFGCLAYLLASEARATDPKAWHVFFWPLVEQCGEVTNVAS